MTSFEVPRREFSLVDVLPSNLQHTSPLFIASRLRVVLDWQQLMEFLQCYGYMMYDREEKIRMFTESPWESVRSAAAACLSCGDPVTFRTILNAQLNRIDRLIADEFQTMSTTSAEGNAAADDDVPMDMTTMDDDDAAAAGCNDNGGNDAGATMGVDGSSADRIVRAARDALRQLTSSLENDETFAKQMQTNSFYQYILAPTTIASLNDSLMEWKHVAESTASEELQLNLFVSCVIRDFITTTCTTTHSAIALILRMGVLVVFLMTQIARNPSVQLKVFATASELAELNETREKLHESLRGADSDMRDDEKNYRNMLHDVVDSMCRQYQCERNDDGTTASGAEESGGLIATTMADATIFSSPVNGEVFVATTILAIVRGAFATFVNWSERLRQFVCYGCGDDDSERPTGCNHVVPLCRHKLHSALVRELKTLDSSMRANSGSAAPWLRVMTRDKIDRIYVNNDALFALFNEVVVARNKSANNTGGGGGHSRRRNDDDARKVLPRRNAQRAAISGIAACQAAEPARKR